jgi:DinB superfamily
MDQVLPDAVKKFTLFAHSIPDRDLEAPWTWGDYDEGIRFAFFRTYEQLRELAARLASRRARNEAGLSEAQRILAQFNAAYWDLHRALIGVNNDLAQTVPAPGEWTVFEAIGHIIQAELGFLAVTQHGLAQVRAGRQQPEEMSEAEFKEFKSRQPLQPVLDQQSLLSLLDFYQRQKQRILDTFSDVTDAELDARIWYWENEPMPLRFRLHRFDSHLRQHTIQVQKTLVALQSEKTEVHRLLGLIYAALAELEGSLIGAGDLGAEDLAELAKTIEGRADEIVNILSGQKNERD